MAAPTDFWLNEALMRHVAYKHLEISSRRLRSIACVAGYVTPCWSAYGCWTDLCCEYQDI
jgi:hypothetical protein